MNSRLLLAAFAAATLPAGPGLAFGPAAPAPGAKPATSPHAGKPGAPAPGAKPAAPPPMFPVAEKGDAVYAQLKAPLFDERFASFPVAQVGDEIIELRELTETLAGAHETRAMSDNAGRTDHVAALDRLIDSRLIVLEARESGMDELPEVAASLKSFRESALTAALKDKVTRGAKADPAEVERLYREMVREWKVRSVLFPEEKDAREAGAQIAGGKAFEEVARAAVAAKKAYGSEEPHPLPTSKVLPHVADLLKTLDVGKVSPPLQVQGGWTLLRIDGVQYPENPRARADATSQALAAKKGELLKSYYEGMVKRWVKVDEALLKSIDFEAPKPGIEALKKDKRALVKVTGDKPVTVGQLSAELEKQFFHGYAEAAKSKKINKLKGLFVDAQVSKIVVPREARRLGLDQTAEYRQKVADNDNSVLFGTYVDKAIAPGLKVQEPELKAYYEKHRAEYALPGFYKLETLAFYEQKAAQAALEKLRGGTDHKWLRANAEGQLKASDLAFSLEGTTVSMKSMPAEVRKSLEGAKKGDYRLHSEEVGHYVIHVIDEIAPSEQPFEKVREEIVQKVAAERIGQGIREATAKLRAAYEVKVYLTHIGS